MLRAIPEAVRTAKEFLTFDQCLREEDEGLVEWWEAELSAWMQDKSLSDPYWIPMPGECRCINLLITSH
jgi:hypothetical protein